MKKTLLYLSAAIFLALGLGLAAKIELTPHLPYAAVPDGDGWAAGVARTRAVAALVSALVLFFAARRAGRA